MKGFQHFVRRSCVCAIIAGAAWTATNASAPRPCACSGPDWEMALDSGFCTGTGGLPVDDDQERWTPRGGETGLYCEGYANGSPCPSSRCCPSNRTGYVLCTRSALGQDPCSVQDTCGIACCASAPFVITMQNGCIGWITVTCN